MIRRPSAKVSQRNQKVLNRIRAIKAEHPFWGYRRIWAQLRVQNLPVNKKRVLRLMRRNDLLVKPNLRLKAKRTSTKAKPRPTRPNEWWGIDMTKVLVQDFGWVYVTVVLDWFSKKIVGYHIGAQSKARHWLEALNMALNRQFPQGSRGQELHLMSDNGCQPTSLAFMESCRTLDIHQAFTSYCNPKGNADTERVMRTLKEELFWLQEWKSPFVLERRFKEWVESDYNQLYPHSTLGFKPPARFEAEYFASHNPQFSAA
jgi:transposase InsO family protein